MKTLIVSGCSFTTNNFSSVFHPSLKCDWPKWPELLGRKLNMKVVNLAKSGSGNEYIFSSILDKISLMDKEEIGLIIPAWSQCQRRDWCENGLWLNNPIPDKGDLKYHVNKSMRYYYMFQELCEAYSIPYKQMQMIELIRKGEQIDNPSVLYNKTNDYEMGSEYIQRSIYYKKIKSENFIGFPFKNELGGFTIQEIVTDYRNRKIDTIFRISEEDAHPGRIGHEMIAEYVYENL